MINLFFINIIEAQEPVGRWLFNGNGHHISNPDLNLIPVGPISYVEGIDQISVGAVHTNPGYFEIPSGLLDITGSMTVSVWWKGRSHSTSAASVIGRTSSPDYGWGLGPDNNGRIVFAITVNQYT
ncbi:MAG: hypothetical protein KDC53_25095, partial [Saprospiraceae bacterium]|nr:hypothetical protein [Saprospiraceae bacterium]